MYIFRCNYNITLNVAFKYELDSGAEAKEAFKVAININIYRSSFDFSFTH